MDDATLGRWIRFLREERGMTQQQLIAEIHRVSGGLWITDSTVSNYERGNLPGRRILPAYAAALDVSLQGLLAPRSVDFDRLVRAQARRFKP